MASKAPPRLARLSSSEGITSTTDSDLTEPLLRKGNEDSSTTEDQGHLMSVEETDQLFVKASAVTFVAWVILVVLVHGLTPAANMEHLQGEEQSAAALAFYLLLGSFSLTTVNPTVNMMRRERRISGVIIAAMTVQFISMMTNAALAWAPTPVLVDSFSHARVFYVRWCEWVPLAGLMTFLAEGVDIPREKQKIRTRVVDSLVQALPCTAGFILPLCPNGYAWGLTVGCAGLIYSLIFPRVYRKRKVYLSFSRGPSLSETEEYDRLTFAYHLLLVCSCVWTVLVVFFMSNFWCIRLLPVDHYLRRPSFGMVLDTFFDVGAKALYMKLIVQVHIAVFDTEGRATRQLGELRRLMSVLWYSSSDAIVVSVKNGDRITTMFSPSFAQLIGLDKLPAEITDRNSAALLLEARTKDIRSNPQEVGFSKAFFVDSSQMPYGGTQNEMVQLASVDSDTCLVGEAKRLLFAIWRSSTHAAAPLLVHSVERPNGEEINCEVKVSDHTDNNGVIAVVRDVTERYRRFDAERRAHAETLARQRDAQAINRFTRHEVKNGLLAGIELCDNLKSSFAAVQSRMAAEDSLAQLSSWTNNDTRSIVPILSASGLSRYIKDLDSQLHETLDTVLAEAMARDVIHEVYLPRLERVVIRELLVSSNIEVGSSDLFPLEFSPAEIPGLSLDPQLVRYIHRNAVSNASKYGKQGGVVATTITFDAVTKDLTMTVTNEPGSGHEELMALAEDANEAVFAQGKRLHAHLIAEGTEAPSNPEVSSGDGAWIMQKCAKTMDGLCHIRFTTTETIFEFQCKAEPVAATEWSAIRDFDVPPGTWGVAIDDSGIQRKLMARILSHVGVKESKLIVVGKSSKEIDDLEDVILKILREHPKDKALVLMDENLDFRDNDKDPILISGSMIMKDILERLSPNDEGRLCVLVRSANDSAKDIALYTERTHGFFPKAPMQRERVSEILAPLWAGRFAAPSPVTQAPPPSEGDSVVGDDDSLNMGEELLNWVDRIDTLCQVKPSPDWTLVWRGLHTLKGDIMILQSYDDLEVTMRMIERLRNPTQPPDFEEKWAAIKALVVTGIETCPSDLAIW